MRRTSRIFRLISPLLFTLPLFMGTGGKSLAADQLAVPSPAWAPGFTLPTWSLVGSWQLPFTNNALSSPTDRRPDIYINPDFTLALSGKLSDVWSYRLYARALADAFRQEHDGNDSVTLVGVRVSRELFTWTVLGSYENRQYYNSIFDTIAFITNDFKVVATRDFVWNNVTLSPSGAFVYRYSDKLFANKYWFAGGVDAEIAITDRTSIVGGPGIQAHWFTDGSNAGRHDMIYSGSIGIKYLLAKDLSLTVSVSYEKRTSNFAFAEYERIDVGPKIDFRF